MAEQSPSRRAAFAASSFANLRAAMGAEAGEPLRIPLADIDEDPGQPRRAFDADELEKLAHTIRERGVLQPIGVLPPSNNRYTLVFGARRLRASKLAGLSDIPAVIVPAGQRDLATQVIENQQRVGLANSELSAAIEQLHAEGVRSVDIAAICNLKGYQVTAFRAVGKLPEFLRARLDTSDIRAIYDLFRAWQKHPGAVQASVAECGPTISVTEARRLVEAVTGQMTGSLILDRGRAAAADEAAPNATPPATLLLSPSHVTEHPLVNQPCEPMSGPPVEEPQPSGREAVTERQPDPPRSDEIRRPETMHVITPDVPLSAEMRSAAAPTFVMEWMGRQGTLVTGSKPDLAGRVYVDIDGSRVTAPFSELRPVHVR